MNAPSLRPATIAIDFDGVIHAHESEWTDAHDILDGPVPGAFDFIRHAIDQGHRIVIFTARAKTATVVPHIYAWLRTYGLEERYTWAIDITCIKPAAVLYIDDRGWCFDGTWPPLDKVVAFTPWNKR